jgi:hypothetical protein
MSGETLAVENNTVEKEEKRERKIKKERRERREEQYTTTSGIRRQYRW